MYGKWAKLRSQVRMATFQPLTFASLLAYYRIFNHSQSQKAQLQFYTSSLLPCFATLLLGEMKAVRSGLVPKLVLDIYVAIYVGVLNGKETIALNCHADEFNRSNQSKRNY